MQALVAGEIEAFVKFPPRQERGGLLGRGGGAEGGQQYRMREKLVEHRGRPLDRGQRGEKGVQGGRKGAPRAHHDGPPGCGRTGPLQHPGADAQDQGHRGDREAPAARWPRSRRPSLSPLRDGWTVRRGPEARTETIQGTILDHRVPHREREREGRRGLQAVVSGPGHLRRGDCPEAGRRPRPGGHGRDGPEGALTAETGARPGGPRGRERRIARRHPSPCRSRGPSPPRRRGLAPGAKGILVMSIEPMIR